MRAERRQIAKDRSFHANQCVHSKGRLSQTNVFAITLQAFEETVIDADLYEEKEIDRYLMIVSRL